MCLQKHMDNATKWTNKFCIIRQWCLDGKLLEVVEDDLLFVVLILQLCDGPASEEWQRAENSDVTLSKSPYNWVSFFWFIWHGHNDCSTNYVDDGNIITSWTSCDQDRWYSLLHQPWRFARTSERCTAYLCSLSYWRTDTERRFVVKNYNHPDVKNLL